MQKFLNLTVNNTHLPLNVLFVCIHETNLQIEYTELKKIDEGSLLYICTGTEKIDRYLEMKNFILSTAFKEK